MMRVKKYECRGRGADSKWGVQKVKGRKKNRGRAFGLVKLGLGRFDPRILGRARREYISVLSHFSFIFPFSFSLFPSWEQNALFSLLPTSSSPTRRTVVEGGGGAVAGHLRRRRRRFKCFFFIFFRSSIPFPLYFSDLKTPKFQQYEPRSERKEKKVIRLCFSLCFGSEL